MKIIYPSYGKVLRAIKREDYELHFSDRKEKSYLPNQEYEIIKDYYLWVYVNIVTKGLDETVTLFFEGYNNSYYIERIDYVGANIKPNAGNINMIRICKELQLQNPQYEFNSWSIIDW